MTDVLTDPTVAEPTGAHAAAAPASWLRRAGAFVVDVGVPVMVLASAVLVAWAAPQRSWLWWVCVVTGGVVVLAAALNRLLLPTLAGFSVGRGLIRIEVVARDGSGVGPWRLLVRDAAHLLDTVPLLLGWCRPLWDSRRRTLADLVARTEVRMADTTPVRAKRVGFIALSVATAVALLLAAAGYVSVYRTDLRLAQAREQLAVQGPDLVTQMLSYQTNTLDADFDRARSAVTEEYWAQLEAQQTAIRENGPVDNDYWAPNAAVLEADEQRGSMIVLLQGQRGTPPDFRTITATVKAFFVRAPDGGWRVDNLTVLASPQPVGGGG